METLALVFLGVIALSSLVQGAFLVVLARGGVRLARRLDELQGRVDREIRPALASVTQVARNVAEVSDILTLQAQRVDALLADTSLRLEQATADVRRALSRPLAPFASAAAMFRGVRRAVTVYRQLGSFEEEGRGAARRYADDEHLFI